MNLIVDGQLANYSDEGNGSVIVLLHGWGSSLKAFDELTKHLAGSYRVIRVDFPGFGGSPKPPDNWHVEDYARFIQHFLAKLGINPFALIGHSFGGRVILKSVGRQYSHPQRIVLLGSAGVKPAVSSQQTMYAVAAKVGKKVTALPGLNRVQSKLRRKLYESAGSTDYLEANEMKQIFLNTIGEDLQSDAARITQPTLLIYGENDESTPPVDGEKLSAAISESKFIVIENAGHYVFLDQPDETTRLIKEFLS